MCSLHERSYGHIIEFWEGFTFVYCWFLLSPPLNTYSGSNIRLTLMPRFTPLKARNESLPLSTSSKPVLTGLSAALIVQVVRKLEASTCSDWLKMG